MVDGKVIVDQFAKLVSHRQPLEKQWKDAFKLTYPHRGVGFTTDDSMTGASTAAGDQAAIYDSTAANACRTLASSMISGLTPANSQWFTLQMESIADDFIPHADKTWLEKSSKILFNLIHSSNYNAEAFEFFQDITVGGMDGLYIEKAPEGPFVFELWSLSTLYVAETLGTGRIDTVYRELQKTASELITKFGEAAVSTEIKDTFVANPLDPKKFTVIHGIFPRVIGNKQSKGKTKQAMPFVSVYVDKKSSEVIFEGGFEEFPVIIPRWSRIPGTPYAYGPVNDCLPDVKMLNELRKIILTHSDLAIKGSYLAPHDGLVNPKTFRIKAGVLNFVRDPDKIKPFMLSGNLAIGQSEVVNLQKGIRATLMADELEPFEQKYASATQVQDRAQTIRQILGPVYSRLQSEFLEPLIRRCFNLAYRDGVFGQAPSSIQSNPTIQYQSPLARAQKMEQVIAMQRFEDRLAMLSERFPQVLDVYDIDKALRLEAELSGVPLEVVNSKEQVAFKQNQQAQLQTSMQSSQDQQTIDAMGGQGGAPQGGLPPQNQP